MSRSTRIKRDIVHILMAVYIVVILFPLTWMAESGFKTNKEIFTSPWSLPSTLNPKNYVYVWQTYMAHATLNSVFFTVVGTLLVILIASMSAYALIRFHIKHRNVLFLFILSGMMLAPQCSLVPIYKLLSILHLYDTWIGLLLPYVAFRIPYAFFLMWSYMITLPVEVEEAAVIDGCSIPGTFFKVVMPMCKPAVATTAIVTARYIWNDFSFALVFTEGTNLRTVPLAIFSMRSTSQTDYGVLLAGLTLAALPVVVFYIVLQKYFVSGASAGAVKG